MKRELFDRLLTERVARRPVALVTRLTDGQQTLVESGTSAGQLALTPAQLTEVRQRFVHGQSAMLDEAGALFVRVYAPPPRLFWSQRHRRAVGAP